MPGGRGFRGCVGGVGGYRTPVESRPESSVDPKRPSYDEEIFRPQGAKRKFWLTKNRTTPLQVEVVEAPELESRVNFQYSKSGTAIIKDLILNFSTSFQTTLRTAHPSINSPSWKGAFSLAPLSSQFEQFHESFVNMDGVQRGPRRVKTWKSGERKNGILNVEVSAGQWDLPSLGGRSGALMDGQWSGNHSRDYVESRFWMGWQKEMGLYLDTAQGGLKDLGIAVRVKSWFQKDRSLPDPRQLPTVEDLASAERWAVTIKVNQDPVGLFTNRREIHAQFSENPRDMSELSSWVLELVQQLQLTPTQFTGPLTVQQRIDTDRMTLNILRSSDETKIGFLTLDQFTRYQMGPHQIQQEGSRQQFEAEILPGFIDAYLRGEMPELDALLQQVQSHLNGSKEPLPKYLQSVISESS